jgi:hypothetical protein
VFAAIRKRLQQPLAGFVGTSQRRDVRDDSKPGRPVKLHVKAVENPVAFREAEFSPPAVGAGRG